MGKTHSSVNSLAGRDMCAPAEVPSNSHWISPKSLQLCLCCWPPAAGAARGCAHGWLPRCPKAGRGWRAQETDAAESQSLKHASLRTATAYCGHRFSWLLVTFFLVSNQISSISTAHSGHRGWLLEGRMLLTAPLRCQTPLWSRTPAGWA